MVEIEPILIEVEGLSEEMLSVIFEALKERGFKNLRYKDKETKYLTNILVLSGMTFFSSDGLLVVEDPGVPVEEYLTDIEDLVLFHSHRNYKEFIISFVGKDYEEKEKIISTLENVGYRFENQEARDNAFLEDVGGLTNIDGEDNPTGTIWWYPEERPLPDHLVEQFKVKVEDVYSNVTLH